MGGGQGGHYLLLPVLPPPVPFCPFVSWLPPFIVFLLLPCKSRCLTPYPNRECFGQLASLSKIKNCVVIQATPHSPVQSLKRHSFETSLHHVAKSSVFCELQSYRPNSWEGLPWTDFSPPHRKVPRRSKCSLNFIRLLRDVFSSQQRLN